MGVGRGAYWLPVSSSFLREWWKPPGQVRKKLSALDQTRTPEEKAPEEGLVWT